MRNCTRNRRIKRLDANMDIMEHVNCIWSIHCKLDCKECPKCHSPPHKISWGCECCDGCNGQSPFKVKK